MVLVHLFMHLIIVEQLSRHELIYTYMFGALIMGVANLCLLHDSCACIVGWNLILISCLLVMKRGIVHYLFHISNV
jgi:hypothetical protein